jgi:electron transfer flavoprotein alpha subunit
MSSNAVVVCTWVGAGDALPSEAEEALTLGRQISADSGAELRWLVIGPMPEGTADVAGRYGVASVDGIDDPQLANFQADLIVEAIAQYCATQSPKILLVAQNLDARLVAPRVAGRTGAAVVMNAVAVELADGKIQITASAYGGDTRVVYELTGADACVVSLLANAVLADPHDGSASAVQSIAVDLSTTTERIRVLEAAHTEGPRLEDAEIIVSGGRGLGAQENYKLIERLADAIGGMAGASRPLVDEGWVDSSHQVGLTGRITRPALYLAAGISGASQHMAGCAAAKTLVAINRDADAAIFRYARYGVVGDCLEILPELIRAAQQR